MIPKSNAEEEAKREQMYDPFLRWQHLQEVIAWAEENMPPEKRRNSPVAAKAKERKLLRYVRGNT